jgi:hypothetical protein
VREHWANLSTEAQDAASHLFANDRCTDIDNAGLQESRLVEQRKYADTYRASSLVLCG